MVDKDDLKSFLRFLDEANDRELDERAQHYADIIAMCDAGSETRRDFQFLQRKLKEEQIARRELAWLEQRRKAAKR